MRIQDLDTRQPLKGILIMLTPEEAKELRDWLEGLLKEPEYEGHAHVYDADYRREIRVAIYTEKNLGQWSPEVQRLIQQDD